MLHELKNIIRSAQRAQEAGIQTVLASVVALEGSSYRRPGVRMSLQENGKMIGAVSGGCVEKEVFRQAQSVFETGQSKLMVYDGRYRLGCEGILYILIEPLKLNDEFVEAFERQCQSRKSFSISSAYSKEEVNRLKGFSTFHFADGNHSINDNQTDDLEVFKQDIKPGFKLQIVGSEHDAVELCRLASNTCWEVDIIAPPDDPKSIENFPGATNYYGIDENEFGDFAFDQQTAVVLMTHSYVKDLKYLTAIRNIKVPYIGLLGPSKRREKLINDLLERYEDIKDEFFDILHGPAGINIGAETPQEIALSIVSEILSVTRHQETISLKDKKSGIHE
ncbi:MAG: XshC-Cox1-family protein [Flavobacteriaceae bacterium]|nr:XshC-Cox1-family protein [Flavobacteriaceae bacterium]|tara:strand:- start:420037 stop:421041 length:1005 start_codon:yes stop_codon:yes gene_type:complete